VARPAPRGGFSASELDSTRRSRRLAVRVREKHLAVFDGWQLETIRAADVEDHVFAIARRAPRAAELMLDTLKMILRNARERGQVVDEAVFRVGRRAVNAPKCASSSGGKSSSSRPKPSSPTATSSVRLPLRASAGRALRPPRPRGGHHRQSPASRGWGAGGADRPDEDERWQAPGRPFGRGASRPPRAVARHVPNELGLVFPTPGGSVWRKDNFMARSTSPSTRMGTSSPTPSPMWAPRSTGSWKQPGERHREPTSGSAREGPRDPRASR
jgi:hypothetical protein